jgi:hypothetical protein
MKIRCFSGSESSTNRKNFRKELAPLSKKYLKSHDRLSMAFDNTEDRFFLFCDPNTKISFNYEKQMNYLADKIVE